jgi:hypothetical protein
MLRVTARYMAQSYARSARSGASANPHADDVDKMEPVGSV